MRARIVATAALAPTPQLVRDEMIMTGQLVVRTLGDVTAKQTIHPISI
jgi:hypothetical protein